MSQGEKKSLFDDDSSGEDDDCNLKINKSYAERYNEWREAEIKRKLEDKYGNVDEELSSSSSGDDENPEELEKAVSKDFFEVISSLRKKDPKIYNPEVTFFKESEEPKPKQEKIKKEKPLYLRDYERKLIVERGGVVSDDESDTELQTRAVSPTLAEKEKELKESFKKIVHSDSEDDEEGLLIKKVKTAKEEKKEEEDYIEWLRGRKQELEDKSLEETLSILKEQWTNPELDEGEKFLRDYILNKRYLDTEDNESDIGNITEDDYQDEYMDEFERKYNFRFEEPDSEFLRRYPRTIESSSRKKDDRRKRHREEVKKRKEEEKLRQREELKVLKSLKRKEIMKKIEKLKEITGNAELGISDKDLEEDYDPEEHDRRMRELFNDDYYKGGDDELNMDELPLPPLEDDIADDYENWDEYEGEEEEELHCEDPNFNMDCDYDPATARLGKDSCPKSSRERRKEKRRSRFGTIVRKKKPEFDPNEKTFQEYLDEYYGIDYEDIVSGIPCRFKYRKVTPNSFGLTIEEILAADDKELNAWVSIKKATAFRPEDVELNEKKIYEVKAQNEALKRKILPSLYRNETENDDKEGVRSKKKMKFEPKYHEESYETCESTTCNENAKKKKKGADLNLGEFGAGGKGEENSYSNLIKGGLNEDSKTNKKGKKREKNKNWSLNDDEGMFDENNYLESIKEEQNEAKSVKLSKKEKKRQKLNEKAVDQSNPEANTEAIEDKKVNKKELEKLKAETYELGENTPDTNSPKGGNESRKKGKKRNRGMSVKEEDEAAVDNSTGFKENNIENYCTPPKSKKNKVVRENVSAGSLQEVLQKKINPKPNKSLKKNKSDKQKTSQSNSGKQITGTENSSERKGRRRRGKDRKKMKLKQKYGNSVPRDVKAENKARAIRKQNYKAAPILGEMSDSRLRAYGLNPKKFKNKLVYGS